MALSLPIPSTPSPVAAVRFDRALMLVSEYLAEARCFEEKGNASRALLLYGIAERSAIASGYTELMRLVWAYQQTPPASCSADRVADTL
jgi:hypothetical protein